MERKSEARSSVPPEGGQVTEPGATLVIGLGNPILGDDGVGWRVAEEVQARLQVLGNGQNARVERFSAGGLALMERMLGYPRAIVIDAISTGEGTAGNLSCLPLRALPDYSAGHTSSAHDTSLNNALKVARLMGLAVPAEVWVVGIEIHRVGEFSERLSPPVEAAVLEAADKVMALLDGAEKVGAHDLT